MSSENETTTNNEPDSSYTYSTPGSMSVDQLLVGDESKLDLPKKSIGGIIDTP